MTGNALRLLIAALLLHLTAVFVSAGQGESGKLFHGQEATLYYEVRGVDSGIPLLVINGGPGVDHGYMHATLHLSSALDELGRDRPIIFYDQRGVGKSPPLQAGQSCTIADQIADLEALRGDLGLARIHLLGHSFGGYLAMAYAARYPERIERLILCDSAAPRFADTLFLFAAVFPETHEKMTAIPTTDQASKKASFMHYFSMLFYAPKKREAYLAQVTEINASSEVSELLFSDMAGLDFTPTLATFDFPTLVLTGRFDSNVAPSVAYAIHKAIPGSQFVVFEESGHLPFYEEQEGFVRTIRRFLSGE